MLCSNQLWAQRKTSNNTNTVNATNSPASIHFHGIMPYWHRELTHPLKHIKLISHVRGLMQLCRCSYLHNLNAHLEVGRKPAFLFGLAENRPHTEFSAYTGQPAEGIFTLKSFLKGCLILPGLVIKLILPVGNPQGLHKLDNNLGICVCICVWLRLWQKLDIVLM